MKRLCLAIAAVTTTLLAACGTTPVEWKPAAPAFDASTAAAIPAAQLADFDSHLQAGLKSMAEHATRPWLQVGAHGDGASWYLGDDAFRGDSGEIDAATLMPLQAFAQRASQGCPCVVHVIGERVGDTDLPSSDIGERRAAAVAAVLGRLGVAPGRLRYESRLVAGRAGGVDLVVVPLIEGSEQKAWVPPVLSGEGS